MTQNKPPGKNIIISAAADGIGWTIASLSLDKGYNVYLSDINQNKIDEINEHPLINEKLFIERCTMNVVDKSGNTKGYITSDELSEALTKH